MIKSYIKTRCDLTQHHCKNDPLSQKILKLHDLLIPTQNEGGEHALLGL